MRIRESFALILATALALPAQQTPAAKLVQQAPAGELKIVVVEGEGGQNNIRSRSAIAPVVEVKDAEDKPVSGAEVTFQLPAGGPGGAFNGWLKTQTVRTDDKGRAAVSGYAPNDEPGRFNIKVTAASGTKTGSVIIAQSNVANGGSGKTPGAVGANKNGWMKWVAILGGVGIAGGVAAAVRGGNDSTTAAKIPVTITAAPVSVGGPR